MPTNLLFIVAVQAATCAALQLITKNSAARTRSYWLYAILFGGAFGILMDAVLGAHGVFAYLPAGNQSAPVEPIQLPITTLIFNAVASYGLAVATFAVIADRVTAVRKQPRLWIQLSALVITLGVAAIIVLPIGTISMMFAWGVVIIGCGELIMLLCGIAGPVIALLTGSAMQLATLWGFSIGIGFIYELANLFFPFWVWLPGSEQSSPGARALVVILGYVALSHPIIVFWALLRRRQPSIG